MKQTKMSDVLTYNQIRMDDGRLSAVPITALVCEFQDKYNLVTDGKCGPVTMSQIMALWGSKRAPSSFAKAVLNTAMSYLGKGEEGTNNAGVWVAKFKGEEETTVNLGPWCAAFIGFIIRETCEHYGFDNPVKLSQGAKALYRNVGKVGGFVSEQDILPGDIVAWDRGDLNPDGTKSWMGHIGIVEVVYRNGDGEVTAFGTIEGNVGSYNRTRGAVRRFDHQLSETKLEGFARLPELIHV